MSIMSILTQSLSYPSGDNCQPFRFKILSDHDFEIIYIHTLNKHHLNTGNLASYLSLGTLIEAISISSRASGYESHATLTPPALTDESPTQQTWAVMKLVKSAVPADSDTQFLFDNLARRETNRFSYGRTPVAKEMTAWIKNEALKHPGISFSFHDSMNAELKNLIGDFEQAIWKDSRSVKDIFRWIRFEANAVRDTKDGMPFAGLGVAPFQKPFLKLFSAFPNLFLAFTHFGITRENKKLMQTWLQNSAGFGFVAVPGKEFAQVVGAGRLIFRIWVYLNAHGYGFQPLTLATLIPFANKFELLSKDFPELIQRLSPAMQTAIRKDSSFIENHLPIWGFRTGPVKALTTTQRTLRRNISDLVEDGR